MSDKKDQQQIEKEIIKEGNFDKAINHDESRDQASYQPETSELDDNKPPSEDSES